jgi:hypothetical protein
LKLEVARQHPEERSAALEAAYALEEILGAIESGHTTHPRLGGGKQKLINRVIEERLKKVENDEKQKVTDRKKLEERKVMLKEQLEKLKEEKVTKDQDALEKKKVDAVKKEEAKKRQHDKLMDDM